MSDEKKSWRRQRPRGPWLGVLVTVLQMAAVLMVVVGVVVAWQRTHRSSEQEELARYVTVEIPSLRSDEDAVLQRLDRLGARPAPGPEAARRLLVDETIPMLIALRKRAQGIAASTAPVRRLRDEYVAWIDALLDACRASVRAIDDPKGDPRVALAAVRRKFADADAAQLRWREDVRKESVTYRLAAPAAPSTPR